MHEGLVFELTIPRTYLYSLYHTVTGFVGPTLCHLWYHPVEGCRTASVAGVLEVLNVSRSIAVPTLRKLDRRYQSTGTLAWSIGKPFHPSRSPALPLDPGWIFDQHLGRVRECHDLRRCHTSSIVRVGLD